MHTYVPKPQGLFAAAQKVLHDNARGLPPLAHAFVHAYIRVCSEWIEAALGIILCLLLTTG